MNYGNTGDDADDDTNLDNYRNSACVWCDPITRIEYCYGVAWMKGTLLKFDIEGYEKDTLIMTYEKEREIKPGETVQIAIRTVIEGKGYPGGISFDMGKLDKIVFNCMVIDGQEKTCKTCLYETASPCLCSDRGCNFLSSIYNMWTPKVK